jgi:hypothetical protein
MIVSREMVKAEENTDMRAREAVSEPEADRGKPQPAWGGGSDRVTVCEKLLKRSLEPRRISKVTPPGRYRFRF